MIVVQIFLLLVATAAAWLGIGQSYKPALFAAVICGSLSALSGIVSIFSSTGTLTTLVYRIVPIAIAIFIVRSAGRRLASLQNA